MRKELPYLTILSISFFLGISAAVSSSMMDYETESILDLLTLENLPGIMIYSTIVSTLIFSFLLLSIKVAKVLTEVKFPVKLKNDKSSQ